MRKEEIEDNGGRCRRMKLLRHKEGEGEGSLDGGGAGEVEGGRR